MKLLVDRSRVPLRDCDADVQDVKPMLKCSCLLWDHQQGATPLVASIAVSERTTSVQRDVHFVHCA